MSSNSSQDSIGYHQLQVQFRKLSKRLLRVCSQRVRSTLAVNVKAKEFLRYRKFKMNKMPLIPSDPFPVRLIDGSVSVRFCLLARLGDLLSFPFTSNYLSRLLSRKKSLFLWKESRRSNRHKDPQNYVGERSKIR